MPTSLPGNVRLASILLIAALAGAGCGDQTAPAGSEAGAAAGSPIEARKSSRTPIISDLHVHDNTLYVNSNSGEAYLATEVTITNPGGKATGLSLQGVVNQGADSVIMSSAALMCSEVEGTLPHGTCTMAFEPLSSDGGLESGSALFTVRLVKDGVPGWVAFRSTYVDVFRF
jgi:hypothetical protein